MKIQISSLTMNHYQQAFALWQQSDGIGLSAADSARQIRNYLRRNPHLSFVAKVNGTLAGVVLGGHDGRRGYIHHLAVHPRFRRRAIGHRLVQHCLQALQRSGIQKCHAFIFANNPAAAFWKKIGWTLRRDIRVISIEIPPRKANRPALARD